MPLAVLDPKSPAILRDSEAYNHGKQCDMLTDMNVPLLAVIALLSASACGGKSAKQSASGQSCEAQVSDLSDWMTKLAEEAISSPRFFSDADPPMADVSTVRPMDNVTMTLSSEAVLVEGSPVVAVRDGAIDSSEIESETASIPRVSSFLRAVNAEFEKAARASDSAVDAQTLNLVIDKLTSWTVVVAVVKSASVAGYSKLEIIFNTPPKAATSSAPPPSSLTKEIAAYRRLGERLAEARLADPDFDPRPIYASYKGPNHLGLLIMLSSDCPPLKEVVDTLGEQEPDKRQAHMTDGVLAAIKQCQCKVEIPALKELYWFSANDGIGSPGIGSVGVALASSETGVVTVVEAAGDSTWQDVHTKVLSLAKSSGTPKVVFKVDTSQ